MNRHIVRWIGIALGAVGMIASIASNHWFNFLVAGIATGYLVFMVDPR